MKKIIPAFLLCVCLLVGMLSGCGPASPAAPAAPTSPGTTTPASAPATTPAVTTPAPTDTTTTAPSPNDTGAAATPQYGGTLKIAVIAPLATPGYTPMCTTNASLVYTRIAYESLITYDESGKPQPMLATSWTTDPNEPSVTWVLRQGVTFADGQPFNAQAVKANIEAYQASNRSEVMNVTSMDIVDDYTIKMHLGHWNSSVVDSIGFFVLYMSPKAIENPDTLSSSTCGTGPFQMTDFVTNVSATYAKNENYWQQGKPYLDGVKVTVIPELTTMEAAFVAEEYDIVASESADLINDLKTNYADKFASGDYMQVTNASGQGLVSTGLIPASADPSSPFADARVRRALAYAIDSDTLIAAFTHDTAIATNQWAVPGTVTYNNSLVGTTYDPDKARALLAEAGYPNGFDTTLNVAGGGDMYTAIAAMLTDVGIRTTLNVIDGATFFGYMSGTWEGITVHAATVGTDLGLYMGRHLGDDATFYAKGIVRPAEAVALLEQIRGAKTDDEKIALEMQMQQLIYNGDDGLMLFGKILYVQPQPVVKHNWIHDDTFTTCFNGTEVSFADAWMSK